MVAERYCLLPLRLADPAGGDWPGASAVGLTPAERQVLAFVCAGYSNKEIASALHKSAATVKHQVSACLAKYGLPSRARLMATLR